MPFVRNIFTGELEEREHQGSGVIFRSKVTSRDAAFAEIPAIVGGKRQRSRALGCLPNEVEASNLRLAQLGIDARYEKGTGDLIINGNQARNAMLDATGTFDRDACYSQRAN